jgi:hypothetical protein
MNRYLRNITITVLLIWNHLASAQSGFYVPKSGKVFFNGDTATIFSDVINNGQLGVGKKAFVNFSGKTWENSPLSPITDESNNGSGTSGIGGWIRFLSDSFRQQIKGGYNAATKLGSSFPRMMIQNKWGVELSESNTKVRKEFFFSEGLVYLNDYIFTMGNNNPGVIQGYDSARFFVTNSKRSTSYLIRENIKSTDGRIDFPVGTSPQAYTPAAIQSHSSVGDDYYVNVFDTVKSSLFSGNNLDDKSVHKTWEIGKRYRPGLDEMDVFLQHRVKDEGSYFSANRKYAYVSRFNGQSWDLGSPQSYPAPGYITYNDPLNDEGVNKRLFYNALSSPSFFTKFTGFGDSAIQTKLWFNARRTGNTNVYVYWKTNPEKLVRYFIVQRRLSTETNFTERDTVASLVNGGISLSDLNYSTNDPNNFTGISFYRLKVVNLDTSYFYSNIVAVGGNPGGPLNLLWPNPTNDVFWVSCDPVWKVEFIVIWNALGQKVRQVSTHGQNILQLEALLQPGTYFVSFIREGGQVIETKKLIVVR